ncbi:hypothetical protein [Streptomyces sp. NPDC056468]|uniref:hypothetical protein n=1 Tax=Streptomyces sp. NPDC056468 TaxID=3345830 RepID=UPI0036D1533F
MTDDLACRRIQEAAQALGFLDPRDGRAKYQAFQRKVADCLAALHFHISEDERYEIAGEAIVAGLGSERLDLSREPLAYCKKAAIRLAHKRQGMKSKEVLVGDYPEECLLVKGVEGEAGRNTQTTSPGRSAEDDDAWELVDGVIGALRSPRQRDVLQRQSAGQDDDTITEETGRTKNAIYQGRTHGVNSVQDQLEEYIRPGHLKSRRSLGGER